MRSPSKVNTPPARARPARARGARPRARPPAPPRAAAAARAPAPAPARGPPRPAARGVVDAVYDGERYVVTHGDLTDAVAARSALLTRAADAARNA
jgi:hypothetical protein